MKSCPTCNRTFEDDLTYCLIDGAILSPPFDPYVTLPLPQQNQTLPQARPEPTAEQQPAKPTTTELVPAKKSGRTPWIIGAGIALLVLTTGVIALVNRNSNSGDTAHNVARDTTKANESANNQNEATPSASETETEKKTPTPTPTKTPTPTPTPLPSPQNSPDATADSTKKQPDKDSDSDKGNSSPGDLRDLRKYVGKYPRDMFNKEDALRERLNKLLGANYQLFMKRWDVAPPIVKDGDFLFSEGCLAHECTAEESLIAIDTSKGIIHTAVLSKGKFRTFSEQNSPLPAVMKKKMQELLNSK